ncbi:MAG: hypothetical protein G01um10142_246 [Parcubacteria group bacterium Gr01-1014_2]|nr:MAG: hypothetical protein G01um10142_246 [Parcubacteria group bacterium Gr01-1014_2]
MPFIVKIIIIIIVLLSVIWLVNLNSAKNEEANFDLMSKCVQHINASLHIHPELEIIINGEKQAIPANIGITSDCMRPVHTHDQAGIIHIEWKTKRDFPLSDFFRVWGKTFNQNQILDYRTDEGHEIILTVNGQRSEEYENLIMRDRDRISIIYQKK